MAQGAPAISELCPVRGRGAVTPVALSTPNAQLSVSPQSEEPGLLGDVVSSRAEKGKMKDEAGAPRGPRK